MFKCSIFACKKKKKKLKMHGDRCKTIGFKDVVMAMSQFTISVYI